MEKFQLIIAYIFIYLNNIVQKVNILQITLTLTFTSVATCIYIYIYTHLMNQNNNNNLLLLLNFIFYLITFIPIMEIKIRKYLKNKISQNYYNSILDVCFYKSHLL